MLRVGYADSAASEGLETEKSRRWLLAVMIMLLAMVLCNAFDNRSDSCGMHCSMTYDLD
jgi:hypothetical protein